MQKKIITNSSLETKKIAEILGKEIKKTKKINNALVINLRGDLGSGKTTFLQGFSKGLGIKDKITSPTFVIMKKFKINNSHFNDFYHFDCYRIQENKDILELGFKEIISNPKNIVAIEWGDSIKKIIPKDALILDFNTILFKNKKIVDENKREIKLISNFK